MFFVVMSLYPWFYIQADPSGELMKKIPNALPAKPFKQGSSKYAMAKLLVNIFFVVQDVITPSSVLFPDRHLALGKGLKNFSIDLVRVQNYSSHMLSSD